MYISYSTNNPLSITTKQFLIRVKNRCLLTPLSVIMNYSFPNGQLTPSRGATMGAKMAPKGPQMGHHHPHHQSPFIIHYLQGGETTR